MTLISIAPFRIDVWGRWCDESARALLFRRTMLTLLFIITTTSWLLSRTTKPRPIGEEV